MKIIDCFTFYNEYDLLFYRLSTLYDVVDFFIIVEANRTHVGKEKPYNFAENIDRYRKFMEKIIYIQVDDLDPTPFICCDGLMRDGVWQNENKQRNYIDMGIRCIPDIQDNDVLIISDVDEIPDYMTLLRIKVENMDVDYITLIQDCYYYNLTVKSKMNWDSAKLVSYKYYVDVLERTPQKCRSPHHSKCMFNGGWHLSYFGDAQFIQNKLQNFTHQEYNTDRYTNLENIQKKIQNKTDLFGRSDDFEFIPIENNKKLPPQFRELLSNYMGVTPY
jgi:beta-1,4-mannosyl-glycoprotein beta-1,4-N-acetylglucosaminyltransferase